MSAPPDPTEAEMRRISAIRMAAVEKHPFWGYLLMQCRVIAAPGLDAIAATDCRRNIYFNPLRSANLGIRQLGFVLLHEVAHHVQASFSRRQGRDIYLWNCATDFAINRIIADIPDPSGITGALWEPPEGILLDRKYDALVAEAIYEALLADREFSARRPLAVRVRVSLPGERKYVNGEEPATGNPVNPGKEGGDGHGKSGRKSDTAGKSSRKGPGKAGKENVGGEVTVEDHGGGIDVHLPGDLDDTDREALEDMVRAAVGHWMATGRRGKLPGTVERSFLAGKPKVDWRLVLRNHLAAFLGREEFSRSRPHRKWLAAGLVMPGFQDERIGRVVVALDTSGSITPEELREVVSELAPLAEEVEDLDLVVADAKVQEVVKLADLPGWIARGKAKGGGGTSHIPVFEWISRSGGQPDLFIGLTDLHTVLPAIRPPFPVLWICPESHGPAPWGRVVVRD